MGVPKFYRWLAERYPLINQAIQDSTLIAAFDCLYIDMNGLIHNATHGNDGLSTRLSDEVVLAKVVAQIDTMVRLARPKQLIYLAVDGVAPRAKMNQQRSRRFRSARDQIKLKAEAAAAMRKTRAAGGKEAEEDEEAAGGMGDEDDNVFDSNCITPGTEFMATVSKHLKFLLRQKVETDRAWQGPKVIFSGHEVPGEGEHKIMNYIRAMKSKPGYNPNLTHCMAGLDADLIMLALATHEVNFSLLREQIDFKAFGRSKLPTKQTERTTKKTKWQCLHIGILREYLEMDLMPTAYRAAQQARVVAGQKQLLAADAASAASGGAASDEDAEAAAAAAEKAAADLAAALPFEWDGERAIDDWVLLTCLCGNDFIPHLPSLDIGEGAMDELMEAYRRLLPTLGGYLCHKGKINFRRLEPILQHVGKQEEAIFRSRDKKMEKFRRRQLFDQKREARLMGKIEDSGDKEKAAGDPEEMARDAATRGAVAALQTGGWRHGKGRAMRAGERATAADDADSDSDGSESVDDEDGGGSEALGPARVSTQDYTAEVDPQVLLMNAAKAATGTGAPKAKTGAAAALAAYAAADPAVAAATGVESEDGVADAAVLKAMELRKQLSLGTGRGEDEDGKVDERERAREGGAVLKGSGKGGAASAVGAGSAVKFLEGLPAADPAVADATDRAADTSAGKKAGETDVPANSVPSDGALSAGPGALPDLAFNEADSPEDQAVGAVLRRLAQWGRLNAREKYYLEKFGVTCDMRVALHARVHHAVRRSFAESLQWCMLYYYQGVPSWSWFFPFHYAPFTSDLTDLSRYAAPVPGLSAAGGSASGGASSGAGGGDDSLPGSKEYFEAGWNFEITFDHARPFHPFMQLLGCLPAASSNFLPECYQKLMEDRASPLAQWFPLMKDIRVDMNGKKNPWEGVTLIPFLPETAMRAAVEKYCPPSALTPEERARNAFGEDILMQYQDKPVPDAKPVPSTMPGVWPSLLGKHSVEQVWRNPELPSEGFVPVPCEGAQIPAPGFPTLHTLPLSPLQAEAQVVTVAFRSRKPSVLLFASDQGRTPEANRLLHDAAPKASKAWHDQSRQLGLIQGMGKHALHEEASQGGYVDPGVMLLQERKEAEDEARRSGAAGKGRVKVKQLAPLHMPSLRGGYLPGTVPHSVEGLRKIAAGSPAPGDDLVYQGASQLRAALGANAGSATAEQAVPLLGTVVYTGWPFLAPAMCVGLSDGKTEITFEGATRPPRRRQLDHSEKVRFFSRAADKSQVLLTGSEDNLLARCGVWIGGVSLIITVRKLVGMRRDPRTGTLTRVFAAAGSDGEEEEAAQLVFAGHPHPDTTFAEAEGKALKQRLPVGSRVVLLRPVQVTSGSLHPEGHKSEKVARAGYSKLAPDRLAGAHGVVVGYSPVQETGPAAADPSSASAPREGLDVALVGAAGAEPEFGRQQVKHFAEQYFDMRVAAKMVGLSEKAFMAMSGSIWIGDAKIDAGLNLVVYKREDFTGGDRDHRGHHGGKGHGAHGGKGGGRHGHEEEEEEHKINNYLFLPGYARPVMYNGTPFHPDWSDGASQRPNGGTRWQYSQRAIDLVEAYTNTFPSIRDLAERTGGRGRLGVKDMGGGSVMVAVQDWLTQLVTFKMPLARASSEVLAPKAVLMLAKAQAAAESVRGKLRAQGKSGAGGALPVPSRLVLKGVPPEGVYGREAGDEMRSVGNIGGGDGVAEGRRKAQGAARWWADGPQLGDRVTNLAYRARPLGERGIVTAVHAESKYVEVLFDGQAVASAEESGGGAASPAVGGLAIPGATGPKPVLVPWHSLLPLTAARDSVAHSPGVAPGAGADEAGGQARGGAGGRAGRSKGGRKPHGKAPAPTGGFAAAVRSGATLAESEGGPRATLTGGGAKGKSGASTAGGSQAPVLLCLPAVIDLEADEEPGEEELAALKGAADESSGGLAIDGATSAGSGASAGGGAAKGAVELGAAGDAATPRPAAPAASSLLARLTRTQPTQGNTGPPMGPMGMGGPPMGGPMGRHPMGMRPGMHPGMGPGGPRPGMMHPGGPYGGPHMGGHPMGLPMGPGPRPGHGPMPLPFQPPPGGAQGLPLPAQQQQEQGQGPGQQHGSGIVAGQPLPAGMIPKKKMTSAAAARLGSAVGESGIEGQAKVAKAPPSGEGGPKGFQGSGGRGRGRGGGGRGGKGGRGRGGRGGGRGRGGK